MNCLQLYRVATTAATPKKIKTDTDTAGVCGAERKNEMCTRWHKGKRMGDYLHEHWHNPIQTFFLLFHFCTVPCLWCALLTLTNASKSISLARTMSSCFSALFFSHAFRSALISASACGHHTKTINVFLKGIDHSFACITIIFFKAPSTIHILHRARKFINRPSHASASQPFKKSSFVKAFKCTHFLFV